MMIGNHPFSVNEKGHLEVGQLDVVDIAEQFGTPLYVYDVSIIRENCRVFVDTFKQLNIASQVTYASKAFSSVAILQVIEEEGLSLDVVSEGELYTAIKAGFPMDKVHMHGNNKSRQELQMAVDHEIGCIIIDNFYEIELLEEILQKANKNIDVLLRVTPGIESETHQYIMTGNEDSKFGFNLQNGQADKAFERIIHHPHIKLKGLHSHIGSQIFNPKSFVLAVDLLFEKIKEWQVSNQFVPEVMNFGGGFGIRYTKDDEPLPNDYHVKEIVKAVQASVQNLAIPMPEIWIEPGRSIVGDAGISLYTTGSTKDIPDVRKYISVDGGMADNIRPALYEAKYEAVIANKANVPPKETVSIAGKCCESGDMLIWNIPVPEVEPGDIVAMFSTGAYGYAMASNYNRLTKPAVVFVENGVAQLVVKRETLDDIVKNDLPYSKEKNVSSGR